MKNQTETMEVVQMTNQTNISKEGELSMKDSVCSTEKNINKRISKVLKEIGVPIHVRGYQYLVESIKYLYENGLYVSKTKELYPYVAWKYETTSSSVERCMRNAIETAWLRGDANVINKIFGYTVSPKKDKASNTEFMVTIANYLKLEDEV